MNKERERSRRKKLEMEKENVRLAQPAPEGSIGSGSQVRTIDYCGYYSRDAFVAESTCVMNDMIRTGELAE